MKGLTELIGRLEKLTGPDAHLDIEIWEAIGGWPSREYRSVDYPRLYGTPLTGSIDAAVALVERLLPGWNWLVHTSGGGAFEACLYSPDHNEHSGREIEKMGPTPAIALCIALLKALEPRP
ncbi:MULTISPECIES: hypothetical protein [unclassified Mesorhizobium]|uniref:hypothetical protein n=1 Tax=unclassified Mesorhizobium TaxID=325217 RepID=UPI0011261A51|nr:MULTISPECIES: hypothetical protein [unclassified Mesorhizobium]TPJ70498.1 hypothetical protein FJ462_07335 [Mesorhizobium sp. B2-6-7]TPJ76845.1 hypothetical protein FJ422_29485 [Mesorhizobium sp. B2-6-3]